MLENIIIYSHSNLHLLSHTTRVPDTQTGKCKKKLRKLSTSLISHWPISQQMDRQTYTKYLKITWTKRIEKD